MDDSFKHKQERNIYIYLNSKVGLNMLPINTSYNNSCCNRASFSFIQRFCWTSSRRSWLEPQRGGTLCIKIGNAEIVPPRGTLRGTFNAIRTKCPPKRPPRGTISAFPILIHSVPPPPLRFCSAPNFFFEKILLFYLSAGCNLVQFVYKHDPVFFTTNCLLWRLFVCLEQWYKLSNAIASIAIT